VRPSWSWPAGSPSRPPPLAVLVATQTRFAAEFATRAVRSPMGARSPMAIEEILSGGWYFTTETARILDGAAGRAATSAGRATAARTSGRTRAFHARDALMSWQLASFGSCCSRSRSPSGGTSARTARQAARAHSTLAAIAALGATRSPPCRRQAITAIVLVSGVAFGAGPGFAVGAISGLLSNILLGQGPGRPGDARLGLVGLIGAFVGRIGSRRLHPLVLALAARIRRGVQPRRRSLHLDGTGSHTLAAFALVLGQALHSTPRT